MALCPHRLLEDQPHAAVIARNLIRTACDDQRGHRQPRHPRRIPGAVLAPPGPDRHDRLQPGVGQRFAMPFQPGANRPDPLQPQHVARQRRTAGDQRAITAHRIADDRHGRGPQRPSHKGGVQGPVDQRRPEGLPPLKHRVVIGAFGMVNRRHQIALGGQVFTQMAHQHPVARKAVAEDDQRKHPRRRLGPPRGAAVQRNRRPPVAQHGAVGLCHAGPGDRGVPDLDHQPPVRQRRLARHRGKDVQLPGIDHHLGKHPDGMGAARGKLWRIRADLVDSVVMGSGHGISPRSRPTIKTRPGLESAAFTRTPRDHRSRK